MLTAIDLDDQPTLDAHEIHDVSIDRFLSSKLETRQLPSLQSIP
jgi:hypothetical protein